LAGIGVLLLESVLDCLDGELARATGKQSSVGRWLDVNCDFLLQCLILFGISYGVLSNDPTRFEMIACLTALASQSVLARYVSMYGGVLARSSEFAEECRRQPLSRLERLAAKALPADGPLMTVFLTFRYPLVIAVLMDRVEWFLGYIGVVQILRAVVMHVYMLRCGGEAGLAGIVREFAVRKSIGTWPGFDPRGKSGAEPMDDKELPSSAKEDRGSRSMGSAS